MIFIFSFDPMEQLPLSIPRPNCSKTPGMRTGVGVQDGHENFEVTIEEARLHMLAYVLIIS